ncbi:ATP-binding protein [Planctomonas sp. JC2975]|uniref:AAA family ATPase n=1 Tax=Planctomonas sp. JC2975 TaxID=2729626 RepID=UPI0014739CD1|nr:ATP-binding protein [Planctomonas sp. JC2975]NNC11586.1 ATP-binding protein [Planctomonas sp. JC2975]
MSDAATLVVMCGLSFSGKSTLAKQLESELGATVVSLDAINAERGLHGGQGISIDQWEKTHEIARERVRALLRTGRHAIVDDTGTPRFIRDRWREIADREHAGFRIVWVTIDEELQRSRIIANRGSNERHDVTDQVMAEHLATFDAPMTESAIMVDARGVLDPSSVQRVAHEVRLVGTSTRT